MASRMTVVLAVALALCGVAVAAPVASHVPAHWRDMGAADGAAQVSFVIAVTHDGAAELEQACQSVSDPDSFSYGRYLAIDEVAKIGRTTANHATVVAWLESVGASVVSSGADFGHVTARMSVAAANELFQVDMRVFLHEHSFRALTRSTVRATIPAALSGAVDMVLGLAEFPMHIPRASPALRDFHASIPSVALRRELRRAEQARQDNVANNPDYIYVPSPTISMAYVNDTNGLLAASVFCPGNEELANTTIPCSNTNTPVQSFEMMCHIDGTIMNKTVPWSNVEMQCAQTMFGQFCQYLTTAPFSYKEGDFFNCSMALTMNGTMSSFSTIPWKNVKPEHEQVMNTPYVTPDFLYNFYNLPKDKPVPGANQSVVEFEFQFYQPSDTAKFYKMYNVNHTGVTTVHGINAPISGGESTLDIEWITAVAPSANTTFWYHVNWANTTTDSFMLGWLLNVSSTQNPPRVFSISYGVGEAAVEQHLGPDYMPRSNLELMKLCTRGISVLVASGDGGSTSIGHGGSKCAVDPQFPTASPWVTSVSATFVTQTNPRAGNKAGRGESAISIPGGMFWTTGGGFSSTAPRPWYQEEAVAKYLSGVPASEMPTAGTWNSSARAYPDVSAIGHNLMCVTGGNVAPVDGTSAATPIFAGILTRLNQARISRGLPAVGFVNPLLYKAAVAAPESFYDIVGPANNRCGAFECCPMGFGYEVAPGYDAVTGLGSLGSYQALENFAVSSAAASPGRKLL